MLRRGQALVETVLAVLVVTSVFFVLVRLSRALAEKVLLEHAAMRVARSRAVGFNDLVCRRVARVAVIPVAGRRRIPEGDVSVARERANIAVYLGARTEGAAAGVLDYEGWDRLSVRPGRGGATSSVTLENPLFPRSGEAVVEDGYTLYMTDGGR